MLAIAGLGLGAAVAVGAGPAQAATAAGSAQGTTSSVSTQARGYWDDDEVVGYFQSRRECERVGRIGEWRDRWDDYDCDRVRGGWGRGAWVLTVDSWNDRWDNSNWYGGWYNSYRGGDYRGAWTHWFRGR
ncbi:hypothetical protein KOI35_43165 [Actinoplanes bogorensis]|uniref:Uncharacterized protein n=1 Tax=Paractinoplanes bogorensis TaxID=1610840 RepID=A0ABS5Z5W1_9ACTN|nr:hypothetical protein [Actinoplanes bogorensis]MBU2670324.1 hypothetical protein [Actinoplanes bogorensis]